MDLYSDRSAIRASYPHPTLFPYQHLNLLLHSLPSHYAFSLLTSFGFLIGFIVARLTVYLISALIFPRFFSVGMLVVIHHWDFLFCFPLPSLCAHGRNPTPLSELYAFGISVFIVDLTFNLMNHYRILLKRGRR